jgi:hypothetical protein
VVILGLFAVQRTGTGRVSAFFGPITLICSSSLASRHLFHRPHPSVLAAINPFYAISFLLTYKFIGFLTLGAVFPGRHRVGSGLYRSRPFRPPTDPHGLVQPRVPGARAELPAARVRSSGQSRTRENPFFLLYPEWAR